MTTTATRTELTKKIRWTTGHQMTIRDFATICGNSDSQALNAISAGIKFGFETGRLPNWMSLASDKFFTINSRRATNTEARERIITAAMSLTDNSTASACKALQAAFGITTR